MIKKLAYPNIHRLLALLAVILLGFSLLSACTGDSSPTTSQTTAAVTSTAATTPASSGTASSDDAVQVVASKTPTVEYKSDDLDVRWSSDTAAAIILNGSSISFNGSGATVKGSKITITAAGTYVVSGNLTDGQIIVDATDKDLVRLVLNGVSLTCSSSAPIHVLNAKKVVIILADGTANKITDGESYILTDTEAEEPNAAIFSKSDLTFTGSGSLTVDANYNHAIFSKDDLKIISGTITVTAVTDGLKGRNYVAIKDGVIKITAGSDGIQANNSEDAAKGFVIIDGGTIAIEAGKDGIQAETNLLINNGSISLTASDDGLHANTTITINGGSLDILKSYEGLESAMITVNNGMISLNASDDGFNVAGGNDGSAMGGRPGQNDFTATGNYFLNINGGTIVMDAGGDGLDSNGSITMTGGTVLVCGPTSNNNGAVDYNGTFKLTGGLLVAAGSSGMAEAPDSTSTQYSILVGFDSAIPANTLVHVATESGAEILTFMPTKAYQSIVFSSPDLANGTTYQVYTGGSSSGKATNGLYSGGTCTGGTLMASLTIAGITTTAGSVGGMNPGGGGTRPGGHG